MELVIVDRDGVVNEESEDFVKTPEEWQPIPGSLDAIARLNHAGFRVVVATNQSGLRRRLLDVETLLRIHEKMHRMLGELGGTVDAVFFCPCHPRENCACYKPNPGMLLDISARARVPLTRVPCVGDALRDVEAARAVGARPILVRTGRGEATMAAGEGLDGVEIHADLAAAADALIAERPPAQARA